MERISDKHPAKEAWNWLVDNKYLSVNEAGWGRIVRVPGPPTRASTSREFYRFFHCIHKLSVWAVSTPGGPRRIWVGTGARDGELVYKLADT